MRLKPGTAVWALFALFIVYGGTIPFRFAGNPGLVKWKLSRIRLNPLVTDTGRRVPIPDVLQNVLLFVPFGVFGVLSSAAGPSRRRVLLVTVAACFFAVGIETLQLFARDRVSSFSDVVADTLGALLGAFAASRGRQPAKRILSRIVAAGAVDVRTTYPALTATALVCLAAWAPFDVTINVSDVTAKLHALQYDVWQFQSLNSDGISLVQYALFGATVSAWLGSVGVRHAVPLCLAIGVCAMCTLEISQIAITSRMPGLSETAVCAVGLLTGSLGWQAWKKASLPNWWPAVIVVATAVSVTMYLIEPFHIVSRYPSAHAYELSGRYLESFAAVRRAIDLVLMYIPVGFCLAWPRSARRLPAVSTIAVIVLIAAPIELLSKTAGVPTFLTDMSLSTIGGLLGAWASRSGAQAFARAVESLRSHA